MACSICEKDPATTYIRIGDGDVRVTGCMEHLKELVRLIRVAHETEKDL